ncbi:MAG: molybdopterin converting factor subunit 1 [Pseudomonadota bacterium]
MEVQYFASLRELAGCQRETLSTGAATAAELYDEVKAKHAIHLCRSSLKVAVNDDFASWTAPLADGDRVVFLPPVAGG